MWFRYWADILPPKKLCFKDICIEKSPHFLPRLLIRASSETAIILLWISGRTLLWSPLPYEYPISCMGSQWQPRQIQSGDFYKIFRVKIKSPSGRISLRIGSLQTRQCATWWHWPRKSMHTGDLDIICAPDSCTWVQYEPTSLGL